MTIPEAIEVFVEGFCIPKSQTHPYVCQRSDGLWVMRDGPGRRSPRKIEAISTGLAPAEVVRRVQDAHLGWHFLCHIHDVDESFDALRSEYKALGYRALSTEEMFVHDLTDIPDWPTDPAVRIVRTQEEANSIPRLARQGNKVIANTRLFTIWDDKTDYGWVRSVPVGKQAWVSGLYVHRQFRGRGYGRGLMSALLKEDLARGITHSVLLASSDGARLYPHLGYRKIGILQMFCPAKKF